MNEQPLDLRAALRELWRRRLLLMVIALLCGLAGLVIGVLLPNDPTANALVLLPSSATITPQNNSGTPPPSAGTDALIVRSTPVLTAAGAKLDPPLGAADLRKLISVKELSGQILQIQAQAPHGDDAVKMANAVAASYVRFMGQLEATTSGPGVAALQQESAQLSQEVNELQTQINTVSARINSEGAGSSAGQQDANLLNPLRSQQDQVSAQLNSVNGQISAAELAGDSGDNPTRVLQTAAAQPMSRYRLPLVAGLIGCATGLLAGVIYVLVRRQRNHRLRLRDEIARTAGTSVIASLDAPACATTSAWRGLLESRPRSTTEWALRHVLHAVLSCSGPGDTTVRVISFTGDAPGLATGPLLALHAATSGTAAVLRAGDPLTSDNRALVPLRAAFTGTEPVGRGLPISTTDEAVETGDMTPRLVVSLAVFDGSALPPVPPDTFTLLSIAPGSATADDIAALALEASDTGSALRGVVVVNAEPADRTSGFITDIGPPVPAAGVVGHGGDDLEADTPRRGEDTATPELLLSGEL